MDLSSFKKRPDPTKNPLEGRFVRLELLSREAHGSSLPGALCGPKKDHLWDYIPFGPPPKDEFFDQFEKFAALGGWHCLAIVNQKTGLAKGTASYMRQRPEFGGIEIGCVIFGTDLQRTPSATEVIYLTASHLFDDLGYRRYEWKCNNKNEASKTAALRFGFQFEGVFRNDMIQKGKNRDTAWFAMTDEDWKALKPGYEAWLGSENFDEAGVQRKGLREFLAG